MKTVKRILVSLIAMASMVTGLCLFAPKMAEVQAASTESTALEGLMNVKMQLKENANGSYDIRMLFGIDNLDEYKAVGFEVYYNNAKKPVIVRSTSVRTSLDAISNGYQYNYSPKAMSMDAEYFAVATIKGVSATKTDKLFYVVPFVERNNAKATIEYGAGRCFCINDGLATDYVNMTLPTDNGLSVGQEIDVTIAGTTVKATVVKSVEDYVFVNIKVPTNGLKAVSKVTYDGETTYYRDFSTAATATNEADTSWYDAYNGTTTTEYTIATKEELYGLAQLVNTGTSMEGKTIYLVSDIVVNKESMDPTGYANGAWAAAESEFVQWVPIGGGTNSYTLANQFAGTFDGQGHTISGLYMKRGGYYLGFFGVLDLNGKSKVCNLKLTNSYFERTTAVSQPGSRVDGLGSIAGFGFGTLDTIYSDVILVNRLRCTGGFVGCVGNDGGGTATLNVNNCWYAGRATGTMYVGGIVGYADPDGTPEVTTNITNCLVNADLETTGTDSVTFIGGVAGVLKNGEVSSCIVTGTIVKPEKDQSPAGLVRSIYGKTTLKDLYYSMMVNGQLLSSNYNSAGSNAKVTATNLVKVSADTLRGRDAYLNTTLDFYEEKWNENGKWAAMKEHELPQLSSFALSDMVDGLEDIVRPITADTSWYSDSSTEFTIYTASELYGLAELCNAGNTFAGKTIKLGKDIVVNKASMNPDDYAAGKWDTESAKFVQWTPIGGGSNSYTLANQFAGIFDGQGHAIGGLYMKKGGYYLGLFGLTSLNGSSTLQNFKLTNTYFERTTAVSSPSYEIDGLGSIVGLGFGTLKNIYSDAIVVNRLRNTGGLVGCTSHSGIGDTGILTIENCWYNGQVTGAQWVGGILGFAHNTAASTKIKDCLLTADVTCTSQYVGGLVGRFAGGTIDSCIAKGTFVTADGGPYGVLRGMAGTVSLNNVYNAMQYNGAVVSNYYSGYAPTATNVVQVSEDALKGNAGYVKYLHVLDFYDEIYNPDGRWVLIKNRLPELRSFTNKAYVTKPVEGLSDIAAVKQEGTKTVTDYQNYLTGLEATGYKLYVNNDGSDLTNYVRTATYTKGSEVVTVSYVAQTSEIYVSQGDNVPLSKHLKSDVATPVGTYTNGEQTTMYMPELYKYGDSFIIRLKNGHFIVIDGGMTADALYLIKDLVELAGGEKPVVEAWFVSHTDSDHAGPLLRFADFVDQKDYADKIIVEGVYCNIPYYDANNSTYQTILAQIQHFLIGVAKCKTSTGATPKVYRPQIGQKYYFDDITVDVMYTHEQLDSSIWSADANEASTWLRFTIDGKTFVHTGDAMANSIDGVISIYDSNFFNFDVITTPHHAQHATENFVNEIVKEDTKILYTTYINDTQTIRYCYQENIALRAKVGEGNYICWGDGTVVITFDSAEVVMKTNDNGNRTWDWHPNRETPTQYL